MAAPRLTSFIGEPVSATDAISTRARELCTTPDVPEHITSNANTSTPHAQGYADERFLQHTSHCQSWIEYSHTGEFLVHIFVWGFMTEQQQTAHAVRRKSRAAMYVADNLVTCEVERTTNGNISGCASEAEGLKLEAQTHQNLVSAKYIDLSRWAFESLQ